MKWMQYFHNVILMLNTLVWILERGGVGASSVEEIIAKWIPMGD